MVVDSGQQPSIVAGVLIGVVGDVVALQRGHLAVHCFQDGVARADVPLLDQGDVHVCLHIALDDFQCLVACGQDNVDS